MRTLLLIATVALLSCSGAQAKDTDDAPREKIGNPGTRIGILDWRAAEDIGIEEDLLGIFADRICSGMAEVSQWGCLSPSNRAAFIETAALRMATGGCDNCQETMGALGDVDYFVRTQLEKNGEKFRIASTMVRSEGTVELQTIEVDADNVEQLFDAAAEAGEKLARVIE